MTYASQLQLERDENRVHGPSPHAYNIIINKHGDGLSSIRPPSGNT